MNNFIISEFIEKGKPSNQPYEFESFDKVEDFVRTFKNGVYSNCYRHEPPYPYLWVQAEGIIEGDRGIPSSYCYFAE